LAVAVGEVGLTPSQYRVMAFLADGESVASSIAGRLNVTKPSVTALIDGLEEKGLVRRRRSDGDRRVVKTVLTDEGREALAAADAAGSARIDSLASHLPKRDRKTAIEGLAIWHEALNAHLAEVMSAR
jgi:long-chain acyl-CoA synthetase